jgi:hypothetical protein
MIKNEKLDLDGKMNDEFCYLFFEWTFIYWFTHTNIKFYYLIRRNVTAAEKDGIHDRYYVIQ